MLFFAPNFLLTPQRYCCYIADNMDIPQFQIARPEFKELRRPRLNQHAHVEVALIDRSQPGFPHVFQLNNLEVANLDQLERLRLEISNLHRDAFHFLGELLQIDTEKKVIALTDDNLLTYKYLIVSSGTSNADDFQAFLPTLKDVLLLESLNAKAKIAESKVKRSPSPFEMDQRQGFSAKEEPLPSDKVAPLVKKLPSSEVPNKGASVNPKRLCQVKT